MAQDKIDLMSDRVFDLFTDVPVGPPGPFTWDFLGVRSAIDFNANWAGLEGARKPKPKGNWEWIPMLWAAATAQGQMVMMECGAGWGPWIVRGHAAARQRGLDPVHIIGVEAEEHHFGYMLRHFADNGIGPADSTAVKGIVAAETGVALFPVATDPGRQWGLSSIGRAGPDRAAILADLRAEPVPDRPGHYRLPNSRAGRPIEYLMLEAWSLTDLMVDHALIDFIHFDIQGAEGEVIAHGIDALNRKVRCIAVGTHSSAIEAQLRALMPDTGWRIMHDAAQKPRPNGILGDGTQVWLNERFL